MKPQVKINNTDIAQYVQDITAARNDLDKDGSGRNILDGMFYRTRIAQKQKWSIKFVPLDEVTMKTIAGLFDPEYIAVTMLNPKTNTIGSKNYYCSTFEYGTQRFDKSENKTYYIGASVNITER